MAGKVKYRVYEISATLFSTTKSIIEHRKTFVADNKAAYQEESKVSYLKKMIFKGRRGIWRLCP